MCVCSVGGVVVVVWLVAGCELWTSVCVFCLFVHYLTSTTE